MMAAPKLNAEQVGGMRLRHAEWLARGQNSGEFVRDQADLFGVSIETVRRALRHETFRHSSPVDREVRDGEVEESLVRLAKALEAAPPNQEGMLRELENGWNGNERED